MREVYILYLILHFIFHKDLTKKSCFEGWSRFKINNLGLVLGMTLKFYCNVANRSKLKVR